jgi:hypothetical protein
MNREAGCRVFGETDMPNQWKCKSRHHIRESHEEVAITPTFRCIVARAHAKNFSV